MRDDFQGRIAKIVSETGSCKSDLLIQKFTHVYFEILTAFSTKLQTCFRLLPTVLCSQRAFTGISLAVTTTHRRGSLDAQALERRRTHTSGLIVTVDDAILVQRTPLQGASV